MIVEMASTVAGIGSPETQSSRTSSLPRPPGRSAICVRTGRRFDCPLYLGFGRSGPCDASLVRELPGTGSETSRLGAPDATKVAGFWAASQPIANKFATPFGQKRDMCTDRGRFDCPLYLGFGRSGPGDASLVRELPGTGSETSRLGAPDATKVAGIWAASQPIANKFAHRGQCWARVSDA